MDEVARQALTVDFHDDSFWVSTDISDVSLEITTDLELDQSSANYTFEAVPLVRKGLRENQIFDVWISEGSKRRVGWIIPANAISSAAHDFAANRHFLKYVYPSMREVLESHQHLVKNAVDEAALRGAASIPFSDLFDDNVAFLVVCRELVDHSGHFELSRLMPRLVSYGWVPMEYCNPENVDWACAELPTDKPSIVITPTSVDVGRPDLASMLFCVAASSSTSAVTQFFYLYQVVELLMEEVLHSILPEIGLAVTASIDAGEFHLTREHLEGLSSKLGEKYRLKRVTHSFQGGEMALQDLYAASDAFLTSVGIAPKAGIDALYQVRNFIVHQVRNMRPEVGSLLDDVTRELALFLASLLGTFRRA